MRRCDAVRWSMGVAAILGAAAAGAGRAARAEEAAWPQFRGPNATGRAVGKLPERVGPDSGVVWKQALPPGHSSPCVLGDRIYVTGVRDNKLLTIALNRADGRILWEVEAPYQKLETVHRVGSLAQPSPAAAADRVVSLFGSCGLFCHDRQGRRLWHVPMGPFNNDFGAGTSPVVVGQHVLLCQDHDTDSFLALYDIADGRQIWKTERGEFLRNYCTPVLWNNSGRRQIVVAGTLRVVGYDYETGREAWTVRGIARTVCMTPSVGEDGQLYLAGWSGGGDVGEPLEIDSAADALAKFDANQNGGLEESELPEGPVQQRFPQFDRNKDGSITQPEYELFHHLLRQGRNSLICIQPGGQGDITASHVAWESRKFLPFCSSPVAYGPRVYTVKDGGIFSSVDARTGRIFRTARLPGTGAYYASLVAGDGKVYALDDGGVLSVIRAADQWEVLHSAAFDEPAHATPALLDGRIYLRTSGHLYCLGEPGQP